MAKHQRKVEAKLARRIKGWEDSQKSYRGKHEQHRPGSQNLRKG